MKEICILKNPIQDYGWGSHTAIPELLGKRAPSVRPQAELWMGAHPAAPSEILVDGAWRPLNELIREAPEDILGERAARRFGGTLPFLFKVLAVAKPLSLQAHPDRDQAREGFARDNGLGIPLTAWNRSYKDPNHKPELICALTPFWALNGFRKIRDTVSVLENIRSPELSEPLRDLKSHPDSKGLRKFFTHVMTMDGERQQRAVESVAGFARQRTDDDPALSWVRRLHEQFPGDAGVLSAILLNVVKLEPGEAMFLPPGRLHCYLEGVAIELMGNSNNVVRGGLTAKNIDVQELLNIAEFNEIDDEVLAAPEGPGPERIYPSVAEEFRLSVITVDSDTSYRSPEDRSVEIIICVSGEAVVHNPQNHVTVSFTKGMSLFVPAVVCGYSITGNATIYKATVA